MPVQDWEVDEATSSWARRDAAVVWHGFTQMQDFAQAAIVVERAEGHYLIDVDGRRYLDAISSLWVNTLGHRVPELDDALRDQLDRVAHSTMLGHGNRVVIELAEALAAVVPVDEPHVLLASDGASAVEQALKIAFQYWINRGEQGRTAFLALGGAYHGDTVGGLSLGDGGFGTEVFDPLRFPVLRAPGFDDPGWRAAAEALMAEHAGRLAAVVVEPLVQAAGGMQMAAPEDVAGLATACRQADVLLVFDEVATGFGRTGSLFAAGACGVRPDLVCLGKGLTGGYLPMAATVASGRVFDAFLGDDLGPRTLYHGHSYGGNALAAAVALRHLQLFADGSVLANVAERSAQLRCLLDEQIAPLAEVGDVRLCGLMVGVELAPPSPADASLWGRRVCAAAVDRGVLLRPLGPVVVLMPPLTVTADEIDRIVDVLAASIAEVGGQGVRATQAGTTFGPPRPALADGGWATWVAGELEAVRDAGQWREVRDLDARGPVGTVAAGGRRVVNFAGNDYLGLSAHPAVVAAATHGLQRWGTGAGASRLVTGSRPVHSELEAALAGWKGEEAALLFPTGYAANLGVLATFGHAGARILSDERNHASVVDGCRLARADVAVWRHADVGHLAALLAADERPTVVVTDSVFSMDGDVAPVDDVARLCRSQGAFLVVDEAHAMLGPAPDLGGVAHVRVGTLSKALGSVGGFVTGPRPFVDLVRNRARPSIFSTAVPPSAAAAALAALDVACSDEGAQLKARLASLVARVRPGHPSPIIPVILGDEEAALAASDALLADGLLVPAIRPPTVAPGTSRLRVTLSAAHTDDQVDSLVEALSSLASRAP
ncbi:MAG: adenosylmethionine--8-amino-7-oxononanoate transaminase [Acidimicrobiales bacterium]